MKSSDSYSTYFADCKEHKEPPTYIIKLEKVGLDGEDKADKLIEAQNVK